MKAKLTVLGAVKNFLLKNLVFSFLLAITALLPFLDGGTSFGARVLILIFPLPLLLLGLLRGELDFDRILAWPVLFLAAFLYLILLSTLDSVNLLFSLPAFFESLAMFLLFCLFYLTFPLDGLKVLTGIILLTAFGLSLAGFYYLLPWALKPSGMNLVYATYGHSHLADYLLFAIPLSFVLFWQEKNHKGEMFFAGLTFFFLVSFILTFSRGSFLVLPVILLFLPFFSKEKQRGKKVWAVFSILAPLVALGLIALLSLGFLGQHISGIFPNFWQKQLVKPEFLTNRPEYWRQAIDAFWARPLFGFGWGAFEDVALRFQRLDSPNWSNFTHNYYLQILAEGGILVFLSFITFLSSVFWVIWRKWRVEKENALYLGAAGAILGSSLHSLIDYDWHFPAVFLTLLFVCAGLINAGQTVNLPQNWERKEFLLKATKVFLVLLSLLVFLFSQSLLLGEYFYQKHDYPKALLFSPWPPVKAREIGTKIFGKDFKEGEKVALRIMGLAREDPSMNYWMGEKYFLNGESGKAVIYYQKAIKYNPLGNLNLYPKLGEIYEKLGRREDRDKLYKFLAYKLDKENGPQRTGNRLAKTFYLIGVKYVGEGRGREAGFWWWKATEFSPQWSFFHDELAALAVSLGKGDRARQILGKCLVYKHPKIDCQNQLSRYEKYGTFEKPGFWREKIAEIPD